MGRQAKIRTIKCRFCEWETSAFRTNKDGKRKNNYDKLVQHCEYQHDNELRKLGLLMYEDSE